MSEKGEKHHKFCELKLMSSNNPKKYIKQIAAKNPHILEAWTSEYFA